MTRHIHIGLTTLALCCCCSCSQAAPPAQPQSTAATPPQPPKWGIVIHTGAGNLNLADAIAGAADRRQAMQAAMNDALMAGYRVLAGGGSSLDAVESAIVILEDSPLFNAGKGAVFTHEGTNELDASIMDGSTMKAGAVAGLKHIKNPIRLARLVMDKSPHVMMAGEGAEAFAKEQGGVAFVDQKYFYTDRAWKALQDARAAEKKAAQTDDHHGTVGAVALDQHGNLAAGTSTGGLTNKRFGRIGDSPIIGAGTYADNRSCGISSTGIGEFWIRYTVAPWYVLGPGHRWPYLLVPMYAIARFIPSKRDVAQRLGLVTLRQMIDALVRAVEHPPPTGTIRIVEVPQIRNPAHL